MSLFNFGFSSKKKNDKGGKDNVEDRPNVSSDNVDQAPAAPGDVATGSRASASGDPGPRGPVMNESDGDPIGNTPIISTSTMRTKAAKKIGMCFIVYIN